MKFDFLDHNDTVLWDDFVAKSPQGSIFTTRRFLDGLVAKYRIGVLSEKGTVKAGIVLIHNELGAYANPLFAKYLGVLFPPHNATTKYVTQVARERNIGVELVRHLAPYSSFDYTFHPNFTNWLPFYWAGFRQETHYTYILPDLSSIDKLLQHADSRVRNTLRKADKNNIQIINGVDLKSFYDINSLSFRRQGGSPPYSFERLQHLYNALNPAGSLHLMGAVDESGRLVSVAGVVHDHRCSYLLLNGYDYRLPDMGANTKLIVEALKYCSNLAPIFDFEGSMIKNIEFFYQSFGAIQVPYFSIWRNKPLVHIKRLCIKMYKRIKYAG